MSTSRRGFIATLAGAAVCPASQWREGEFRIARACVNQLRGESDIVRGYMLGCFGIRQYSYIFADEQIGAWNVTHLPSGYALGLHALTKAEAQRMVERLVAAGDWSRIDGPKHPDVERLKPFVMALRGDESA